MQDFEAIQIVQVSWDVKVSLLSATLTLLL